MIIILIDAKAILITMIIIIKISNKGDDNNDNINNRRLGKGLSEKM